jgi:alkylation response protein AidB-like acyl-CoA dehydrogenase
LSSNATPDHRRKKENKLDARERHERGDLPGPPLPQDAMVGQEGQGSQTLAGARRRAHRHLPWLWARAGRASRRHANERRCSQPIAWFQAIRWKLADMATRIEAARLLTYRAAWLRDQKTERISTASSMAKLYSSEVAVRAAEECVQIHGGYGFVKDYPAEKYFRDVKLCTIGEGTSEIQRLVIARQLLGR